MAFFMMSSLSQDQSSLFSAKHSSHFRGGSLVVSRRYPGWYRSVHGQAWLGRNVAEIGSASIWMMVEKRPKRQKGSGSQLEPVNTSPSGIEEILRGLDSEQRKAVTAPLGPVLVIAGPGSGKTRVLAHRIAYVVEIFQVHPRHILAVTFTRRAANELRTRIRKLSSRGQGVTVTTFHSFCAAELRRGGSCIGLSPRFRIIDRSEARSLFHESILLNLAAIVPPHRRKVWDSAEFGGIVPWDDWFDYLSCLRGKFGRLFLGNCRTQISDAQYHAWLMFEERKRKHAYLDFADLLERFEEITEFPGVLHTIQTRYRNLLVDEFQDTDLPQYHMVATLASLSRSIFLVGDVDQAIYGWRGASPDNFNRFARDFPDCRQVALVRNYRSSSAIVLVSFNLIAKSTCHRLRVPPQVCSKNDVEVPVTAFTGSRSEQKEFIALEILRLMDRQSTLPGLLFGDIAVLARTHSQVRELVEFLRCVLPVQTVSLRSPNFVLRKEVQDLLSLARLVADPFDLTALGSVLNTVTSFRPSQTAEVLRWVGNRSIGDALNSLAVDPERVRASVFLGGSCTALQELDRFANFYETLCCVSLRCESILDLLRVVRRLSAFDDQLYRREPREWPRRLENLAVLEQMASAFDEIHDDDGEDREEGIRDPDNRDLSRLVQDSSTDLDDSDQAPTPTLPSSKVHCFLNFLVLDAAVGPQKSNAVHIMTLHAAKGTEFSAVFLYDISEGLLPRSLDFATPAGLDEERRLLYVGFTRAKHRLVITCHRPSIFLTEANIHPSRNFGTSNEAYPDPP